MKSERQDILTSQKELKDNPFGVPAGYFEAFKSTMSEMVATPKISVWRRSVPYMAAAACLALLLSAGTLLLNSLNQYDEFTQEDYILFSDNMINTAMYEDMEMDQMADAELIDEDIIEYLIYIGVSPESIELSK